MALAAFAAGQDGKTDFDSSPPLGPLWQPIFQQTFSEWVHYGGYGVEATTTGTYYYDVSNPADLMYRIDRANGEYDRYCGLTHHMTPQPCHQYVKDGDRYLYYPDADDCCYCCSAP